MHDVVPPLARGLRWRNIPDEPRLTDTETKDFFLWAKTIVRDHIGDRVLIAVNSGMPEHDMCLRLMPDVSAHMPLCDTSVTEGLLGWGVSVVGGVSRTLRQFTLLDERIAVVWIVELAGPPADIALRLRFVCRKPNEPQVTLCHHDVSLLSWRSATGYARSA